MEASRIMEKDYHIVLVSDHGLFDVGDYFTLEAARSDRDCLTSKFPEAVFVVQDNTVDTDDPRVVTIL